MGDFETEKKVLASAMSVSKRTLFGALSFLSGSGVARVAGYAAAKAQSSRTSSRSAKFVVKLNDCCEEECDREPREAQFAIRATDLSSWTSSFSGLTRKTDSDPKTIQHWALVVHFPRGKKTYLFEAVKEDGQLQAGLGQFGQFGKEGIERGIEIFIEADYIGEAVTSPRQLLEIAKQVTTGKYSALGSNNCQTWLTEFLNRINSACAGARLSLPYKYRFGLIN